MKKIFILFLTAISLVSCASSTMTMGEQYPAMYEEKPLAIAIMPPINQTNHVEAKDFFFSTLYMPLCEKGYYVFSPYLTMEMFQQESAYDAELFLESDLSQFRNVLGADAAMFTIIKDWRRNNVGGSLTVEIEYILRSTKTGKTLYSREGRVFLDTSIHATGGGLIGALVNVAATAIATAATDKVEVGRKCNEFVFKDLPAGRYSSMFEKDAKNPAGKTSFQATIR